MITDYRTLWQITWPVWQAAYDFPPGPRSMTLGCRDLL